MKLNHHSTRKPRPLEVGINGILLGAFSTWFQSIKRKKPQPFRPGRPHYFWLTLLWLGVISIFYYVVGKDVVYFRRDDLDSLVLSARGFSWQLVGLVHSEHFTPIVNLLYFLEFQAFRLNPLPYFLILLSQHAVNIWLAYLVGKLVTGKSKFGFLAALLYGVAGGIYFEVLLWPIEQVGTINGFFIFLATYLFLKYRQEQNLWWLWLSGLSAFLSSLAFGIGVLYPFVFVIYLILESWWQRKKKTREMIVYLFWGAVSLLTYLSLAGKSLAVVNKLGFNLPKMLGFWFIGLAEGTVVRFFLPLFSPTRKEVTSVVVMVFLILACLSFLLVLAILAIKKRELRKKNLPIVILVALNLVYPYFLPAVNRWSFGPKQAMSERYAYVPLFFLAIFLSFVWSNLLTAAKARRQFLINFAGWFLLSLVVFSQAWGYYQRTRQWQARSLANRAFLEDLAYIFNHSAYVLDLPTPQHFNTNYYYSDLVPLLLPRKKPIFIRETNSEFSAILEADPRIKQFYAYYLDEPQEPTREEYTKGNLFFKSW